MLWPLEMETKMRLRIWGVLAVLGVMATPSAFGATSVERFRNAKVVVTEETLGGGEREAEPDRLPSMLVYMSAGMVQGAAGKETVKEGQTVFRAAGAGPLENAWTAGLHFVRIDFLTPGSDEIWGTTGLSPKYVVVLENKYARAYDIKIPAQTLEPKHTHHDRVVVCLSGAELEHIMPDGSIQPSTLKTGEVGWRLGATHTGHNLGHTDLWVIAVEPK
jgi:hypothetical protein